MVDVPALELRVHISDPYDRVGGMKLKTSFKNTSCPLKLALFDFPLRVSQEVVDVHPIPSYIVLKVFSLSSLEFMKLLEVGESGSRYLDGGFCAVYSFAEELLGGDLFFGGGLVLDAWGTSTSLHVESIGWIPEVLWNGRNGMEEGMRYGVLELG